MEQGFGLHNPRKINYLQRMIAFIVLLGLTYSILESYIDNIVIIHAQIKSAAQKPTEYLNLMQEIANGEEELAVLAQAPSLSVRLTLN